MTGHWVCKICILTKGIKGKDLHKWPLVGDEDGIIKHLVVEHGQKVSGYDPVTGEKLK